MKKIESTEILTNMAINVAEITFLKERIIDFPVIIREQICVVACCQLIQHQ